MLTAYDAYKDAHKSLFDATAFEQIHQASRDTVENYLENRRIWDELNYYKLNGSLLAKHPIFGWMKRLDEIRQMPIGVLVNLKIRIENNLVRNRATVRRDPKHLLTSVRLGRIAKMEQELTEVDRLLNIK